MLVILAFFHLNSLLGFPYHLALHYLPLLRLLDLLLRLFLAWRWVEQQAYCIPRWIVSRSWHTLKRPVYHILTEAQANHVQPWFVLLPCRYLDESQYSLRISSLSSGINTFSGWHTMNTSVVTPIPIKQPLRALCLCSWCRWGCYRDTLSRKRQASQSGSYWYNSGT